MISAKKASPTQDAYSYPFYLYYIIIIYLSAIVKKIFFAQEIQGLPQILHLRQPLSFFISFFAIFGFTLR